MATSKPAAAAQAEGLWANFQGAPLPDWLPECFDHMAARFYLEAEDVELTPQQQRRIDWWLQDKQAQSLPFTTAYEEPDPNYGAIQLSTLSAGEYGDFKIVNQTDPRISDPPVSPPTQPAYIHLCWTYALAGLQQRYAAPAGHLLTGHLPATSVLQGLAALLLDDWRWALRGLPVRWFAHKGKPDLDRDRLGRGDEPWKAHAHAGGSYPPADMVTRFFTRCRWTEAQAQGWGWNERRDGRSWWCACLLACDLPEFGFEAQSRMKVPVDGDGLETDWVGRTGTALPDCLAHVIVVEPPDQSGQGGTGQVCRVIRETPSETHLQPVRGPGGSRPKPDAAYRPLRALALRVMLDALGKLQP